MSADDVDKLMSLVEVQRPSIVLTSTGVGVPISGFGPTEDEKRRRRKTQIRFVLTGKTSQKN